MAKVIADNVLETTAVTGTGNVTLLGAVQGFKTVDSVASPGDTFDYTIAAVNADKVRTGAYETGIATYSGSNVFVRTTVHSSSNGDALVDFAAGTKIVTLTYNATSLEALEAGGGGGGGGLTLIGEATPGTFSKLTVGSIPNTYKSLYVEIVGRSTATGMAVDQADLELVVGGSAANNDFQFSSATDGTMNPGGFVNQPAGGVLAGMFRVPANDAPANAQGTYTVDVPDYAGSKLKNFTLTGGLRTGTTAADLEVLTLWGSARTTGVIDELTVQLVNGDWATGSRMTVWGRS